MFYSQCRNMTMRTISIIHSMAKPINHIISVIFLSILFTTPSFGQSNEVKGALQELGMGNRTNAMNALLDLIIEFPDDPGVVFLHASLLKNNAKAIPMYKKIVKGKPDSEWADDAQFRIVSYYATKRDTVKAREEMQKFRDTYPRSEFLPDAYEILRNTVGGAGKNNPQPKTDDSKKEPISGKESLIIADTTEIIPPSTSSGSFTLQVGVFKTRAAAEEEYRGYKSKRMRCDLSERKMPDGSMRYVVTIGEYTSRKNAEAAVPIVRDQCNCTPLIIQKAMK